MKLRRFKLKQSAILAASIHLAFGAPLVWGNPTGPQVVNGSATFQNPSAGTLNVTNSPGAIINWQGFSIGANEVTRFIQNSASSAVLNRVVGPDISSLQGQLLSNGRVFLINPAGIVIGPGAMIDTAGFVGSTLNMLDADFIGGRLKFQGDSSSGSVINQGWIRTGYGGQVILVAPNVENSGLIQTPGGELILAAGKSMTIGSLQHEGVQFEIQAPTDSVLNVGKLLADGGAVGVFAGTLRHSGEIRANALARDEGGNIVLRAANDIQIAAGSITSANGKTGGNITIESAAGHSRIAGQVTATGSDGKGGDIRLLGDRVTATDGALVDASGSTGGGQILLGGDYQGNNPAVRNATNTFVGATATLRADATQAGDGGRIIVWSDDKAQFYGNLSARGGPSGGNGGFAEVSGKQNLIFAGGADFSAPLGASGNLLLDPLDLYVFAGGGLVPSIIDENTDFPSNAATVSPATLAAIAGNVTLFASRYMRISDPIVLNPGQSLTASVGTWTAPALPDPIALDTVTPNLLDIAANITTSGGSVTLTAPSIQALSASTIATAGGAVNLNATDGIQAALLSLNSGAGAITVLPGGFLHLGTVTGGSFTATAPGSIIIGGHITTVGGPISLSSTGGGVLTWAGATTGGGAFTMTSTLGVTNIGVIAAGGGAVSMSGSSVSGGTIDTTGAVSLTGTSTTSSVSATVNNASSLTAIAGCVVSTFPACGVSIDSSTDLNVAMVTAGSSGNANLYTSSGTIRATSDAAKISGLNVTLRTGQLTGGGIVGAALPLNVDAQGLFDFRPNGTFDVSLSGTGPNRLNVEVGVAPATQSYSGMLTGPGLVFSASANDSTVTFNNLAITSGFDQRVQFTDPSITFRVPNGTLVANSVTVPTGDTVSTIPFPNGIPLPVSLSAFGNLTISSYLRAGGGLTKSTSIVSNTGNVTLGTFDASKDNVSISNSLITTISNLITAGNVTISSGGTQAQSDSAALEINAGGTISISSSGSIGTAGFTNPLDLTAASISLSTINSGSMIGDVTGPVLANTENLTISAPFGQFNVSTGSTALKNLTVTADPSWVGNGGLAQVRTEVGGANDKTYAFASDGTDFTLAIGTVPVTQFSNGNFSFTSESGNINLTGNTVFGTGNLNLTTNGNGIFTSGGDISAANVTLTANSTIDADNGAITATGTDGNITLRADSSIVAGNLNAPGTIDISNRFCCADASVSVGAIGNVTAPQSIFIRGSNVEVGAVAGAGDITLNANNGLLTLGGAVTTADGSTVTLRSTDNVNALSFSSIDAGLTGTVSITSSSNIIQTSVDAAGGITAENVTLTATGTGGIGRIEQLAGDGYLYLFGVKNLTVNTGEFVQLNAQGSTLTDLTVSRNQIPDNSTISLINLGSSQSVDLSGGSSDQPLTVDSPSTPLNFSLDYFTGGDIVLAGTGINTSGGSVELRSSGGIDATTGGITTAGGNVYLEASGGTITTGVVNASGGAGTGRVEMWNFAGIGTSIDVSGNVTAGSAGSVFMAATGGSIINSGGAMITAGTSATLSSNFGNLGTAVDPLLIMAPSVTLSATGNPTSLCTSSGCAFATLTGTSNLTLTAYDGFNVSSDTALSTLSLTTRGFGYGNPGNSTLNLSAPGQTYIFDRPIEDIFLNSISNTFQVVSVIGPTTASFATDTGDLLVAGGGVGAITVPNLTFFTSGTGDLKLQGIVGDALNLSSSTQSFSAGRDLLIAGTVDLTSSGSQSFSSGQDLLITGDIDISSGGNQTLSAIRHIGVTATGGSTTISGFNQAFTTSNSISKMEFLGGAGADEKVMVLASNNQTINSTSASMDSILFLGGSGANASVMFSHSGAGVQQFRVGNTTITVEGGSGSNAFAKIEDIGSNQQQLCASAFSLCDTGLNALNIQGGSGDGAFAQITAAGSQLARIVGSTRVLAGTGDGAYALMQAGTSQIFLDTGNLTVQGGSNAATTAKAEILAASTQSIMHADSILVEGGAGMGSLARIATPGSQTITGFGFSLPGLTLNAGGTEFSPIAGASAIVEGGSQSLSLSTLTLNGGAGTGAGTTSDALLRTLTGGQIVNATTIALNGGHQFSTAGILNQGTGTQTVTGSSGITLTSDLNGHSDAFVLIQNTPATLQTINASNGSLRLNNRGGGTVSISSGGAQTITAGAIEVLTNATTEPGPGIATISAAGNQWIRTLNGTLSGFGSMRVAALGGGTASIESAASQLIQLDYPEQMQAARDGSLTVGDINAAGTSRIKAVDQTLFAKSIVVQSGATNSLSEIKASNNQVITTLNGNLQVLGGSGDNTLAQIDPVMQSILVNGGVDVTGGSGVNAIAQIVASSGTLINGQTIYATNGDITLTGGTGAGAAALITNFGSSSFVGASGDIILIAGTQPGADAIIAVGGGPGVLTLLCGGSCILPPVGATPTAGILANQSPSSTSTPFDTTSTLIALQQDQDEARFDAVPDESAEEAADVQRAPICQ